LQALGDVEELHLCLDIAVTVAVAVIVGMGQHFALDVDLFIMPDQTDIWAIDLIDHLAIVEVIDGFEFDTNVFAFAFFFWCQI
jgi:hypothetical protein